jgi:hypothetical protein
VGARALVGLNRSVLTSTPCRTHLGSACGLQPQLACWTIPAELGPSHITAHGGQAAMPRVTHNFFVRHAVPVGCRHEPGAEIVRADRFRQRAPDPGPGRALHEDLRTASSPSLAASTTPPRLILRNSGPAVISDRSNHCFRAATGQVYHRLGPVGWRFRRAQRLADRGMLGIQRWPATPHARPMAATRRRRVGMA